MDIRKKSVLADLYKGPRHPIDETWGELKLIRAAVSKDPEAAASLFCEIKLFGGDKCAVDAPYGRYEGLEGIRKFAETFLSVFHADSAEVIPVIQTRSGGRSVTELQIDFVVAGMIEQVPMFVVADLRTRDLLDEVRIYCHCSYVPGLQAYRKPIFKSAHLEVGDPGLLTGAVREYYEALHSSPACDVERIMNCVEEGCIFGGYLPAEGGEHFATTPEKIREEYVRMATYIPRCVAMRYETIIDDGVTGIIEWVHIISRAGQEERNRIALSGIAAYERGETGKLISIRISDYAGLEGTIDWSRTNTTKAEAQKVNFVEVFSPGVGTKKF